MPGITSYPSQAQGRLALAVLFAIGMVTTIDVQIIALLLEPMKRDLGLTDVQLGVVTSTAYFTAYGLASAPMGMLADRCERLKLLRIALLLWCAGLALMALSHTAGSLIGSKAIVGVAAAMTYPAAMSLLSDFFSPDRRSVAMMSYPIGVSLGGLAATLCGGFCFGIFVRMAAADPHSLLGLAPWRAVSLLFTMPGLLVLPFLMLLREPPRQEVGEPSGRGRFRELWTYRGFLLPNLLAIMCIAGVANSLSIWIIPALMRLYGQQPSDFAGWYGATAMFSSLFAIAAGTKLVERARKSKGRAAITLPAMWAALLLAPTCLMAMMPSVYAFAAAMVFFLFFGGIALSIPVIAINFRIPNELRGLTMGVQLVLVSISGASVSPITAAVGARLGGDMMIGRAMAIVGLPLALAAAFWLWVASRPGTDVGEDPVTMPTERNEQAG